MEKRGQRAKGLRKQDKQSLQAVEGEGKGEVKYDQVSSLGVWKNWGAINQVRGAYTQDTGGKLEMPVEIIHLSSILSKPSVHPSVHPSITLLTTHLHLHFRLPQSTPPSPTSSLLSSRHPLPCTASSLAAHLSPLIHP